MPKTYDGAFPGPSSPNRGRFSGANAGLRRYEDASLERDGRRADDRVGARRLQQEDGAGGRDGQRQPAGRESGGAAPERHHAPDRVPAAAAAQGGPAGAGALRASGASGPEDGAADPYPESIVS